MTRHSPAATLIILLLSFMASAFQTGDTWTKFESSEGRFTVLLPSQPKIETRDVDTAVGKVTMYSYSSSNKLGYYMVSFGDYPSETTDAAQKQTILDGVRGGVLKGLEAEITSEDKFTLHGHPGREFKAKKTFDGSEVVFTWKIVLVGRRLYQVAAGTSPAEANAVDVVKFLSSFDLLNK